MLTKKEVRPGLQAVGIVSDILRGVSLPRCLGIVESVLEVLASLNLRAFLGGFTRFSVLLTLVGSVVIEREVGITCDRVNIRSFKHRKPGAGFVEKFLYLVCGHRASSRIGFIQSEHDCTALIGVSLFFEVRNNALQLGSRVSGERILLALDLVDRGHSLAIFGLLIHHLLNEVHRVVSQTLGVPQIALDGL